MVTNLLKPRSAVLYVTLPPHVSDSDRGSVAMQSLALGGIQMSMAVIDNCIIVLAASTVALMLARRPGWVPAQRYFRGRVLGALALRLATERTRGMAAG